MNKVTDPALLETLNGGKVTDPNLLAKLNGDEEEEDEGAYLDTLPPPEGSHPIRDIFIGLTHAGRNLHNLPHYIVQGAENAGESFANSMNKLIPLPKGVEEPKQSKFKLSEHLPYDPSSYADVFGQEGEGTLLDQIIQKGTEHAPELIGAGGLIRGGFRRLKGTHQLDKAAKLINQKGLNDFMYPKSMIKEAKKFLPDTQASKELIKQAQSGNYEAAMKLQSQIGHHQRKLAKSPLASENSIMAPKAGELKQSMLGHLERVLRATNNHDEADLLRGGIRNYGQYKRVMNAAMPAIKYFGIPTSILTALGFGYRKLKQGLSD